MKSSASERPPTILFLGADAAYLYAFRAPLMRIFRARGYRVVAVAGGGSPAEVSAFDSIGAEFIHWPMKKAGLDPVSDIGPLRRLWLIFRDVRPTILFAHTIKPVIYGLILGWIAGIPRRSVMIPGLGYAFTDDPGLRRRLVGGLARLGYRLALTKADIVIFQNQDDLQTLREAAVLAPTARVGIVNGSGVDMSAFTPAPWPKGPASFLMLARLLRDKGVYEFVEAARIVRRVHPDARFVLAGGTDVNPAAVSPNQVREWVAEGLIEAPGHITDPRPLFSDCHVFVLPSYYREGCPRVNLEAMAMGRAVVTTDWVGCRDTVIDGQTGYLVPPRDAASLGRVLLKLATDLPLARSLGEAGRRYCQERFELEAVANETSELICPSNEPHDENLARGQPSSPLT